MASGYVHMPTRPNILGSGEMERNVVKEHFYSKRVNMWGNGIMILWMVKEIWLSLMAILTVDSG